MALKKTLQCPKYDSHRQLSTLVSYVMFFCVSWARLEVQICLFVLEVPKIFATWNWRYTNHGIFSDYYLKEFFVEKQAQTQIIRSYTSPYLHKAQPLMAYFLLT